MNIRDITVIVPTKNEETNILPFLHSVPQPIQLIVVDASTDATPEIILKTRPHNTTVIRKNTNIPVARQIGAEEAKTSWLLFTDSDVSFADDYFKLLEKKVYLDGFYGAKLSRDEYRDYYERFTEWQEIFDAAGIPAVSGSNMAVRKKVLMEVGGFDPDLSVNEDTEIGFRMSKRGYLMNFDPELIVYAHDHRRLKKGRLQKTLHSMARSSLLYLELMPEAWKKDDWGYWK